MWQKLLVCPKSSLSLLPWLQSSHIYLGTLKPGGKPAFPSLPCSYPFSQVTKLRLLGKRPTCWVGLLRRLFEKDEVSLHPTFSPSCCLVILDQEVPWKTEAVLQSREKGAGLLMILWSGHTSSGLLISRLLLHENTYPPGWFLGTSRQMPFLMYTPRPQPRPP